MTDPMFKLNAIEEKNNYGKFTIEPLEQGYGNTLGNALRRVLLSSLKGASITSVKFENVKHSFSMIPGMKEDVVEFILNVKKIRLQLEDNKEVTLKLEATGPTIITAANLEVPNGVTIVNKDQYLATLSDKKARVSLKMGANIGYGYVSSEEHENKEYGVIPVDSLFSPVLRVNYKTDETRAGSITNLDKRIIEL